MDKKDIIYKMVLVEEITKKLGDKLMKADYKIEDMGCPHTQPKKLPKGWSAVYIFIYENNSEYEYLKVGKANDKSSARFCSQHYGFSAPSTLAKSICKDKEFVKLGITEKNVKKWMLNNLHRINIYIRADKAKTELIEAILHYAYRPRYEGNL